MPAKQPGLKPIRVLVGDSTRMGTQLLAAAIRRDRRFTVEAIGGLENIAKLQPPADVAVVSIDLNEKSLGGFELARQLNAFCPELQVVMLLDTPKPELVIHAFKAGAQGVICRNESSKAVCKCIHAVHRGQVWATHEQLRILLKALRNGSSLSPLVGGERDSLLTNREQEVVRYVARGLTNREIAKQMNLSEHTIKGHLCRIFEKLGVSSRVEVVLYAFSENQPTRTTARSPAA